MDKQNQIISAVEIKMEMSDYEAAYLLLQELEDGNINDVLYLLKAEVCRQLGYREEILPNLIRGAAYNSNNYEIYFMMGDFYKESGDLQRAYFCYVHSACICDQEGDKVLLDNLVEKFKEESEIKSSRAAIIIPSVPSLKQMESILRVCLRFCEDCRKIIVIDWNESQMVSDWLKRQKEIMVVSGNSTMPSVSYQEAADLLQKDEDILLLGKGSILLQHTLYQLRMSLYGDPNIGVVNSVTNSPVKGQSDLDSQIKQACMYADSHNLPGKDNAVQILLPSGNTIFIKRECWTITNGFDCHYSTLEGMEKDLCFQLLRNKRSLYLCYNAFSYTITQQENNQDSRLSDYNYFYQKWNVHLNYSFFGRTDILALLTDPKDAALKVLEVGCACGATLLALKNRYPHSELHGIELDPGPCEIASFLFPVTQGNIEETLDYPEGFFDYIIFGDVLEHLYQPQKVLENMKRYLNQSGIILASIPNVMHISVVNDLLNGYWTYQDSGILDRTHLRFFTKTEIIRMFLQAGYQIEEMRTTQIPISEENKKMIDQLRLMSKVQPEEFMVYQYLIKAQR
ncbi:class I SAM-dependent methyltransferase [Lachnospiraceae bacterium 54-53]